MELHPSSKMKPERRNALFAAATQEFTEYGFEQASLNRIIGEVGMSKSSFYHYFANKTELFQQIFQQTLAPVAKIVERFEPESLTKDTFWPAINASTLGSSEFLLEHPELFNIGRMFHRNLHEPNGICADMMKMPMDLITRLIERGKEIGTIRDDLPTSLLLSSAIGLGMAIDRWAIDNSEHFTSDTFIEFQEKVIGMFVSILGPVR